MDGSDIDFVKLIGAIVTIASALSNVIPAHTIVGKILHFFALNFRTGSITPPPEQPGGGA
jgi:hypothetical protein